jgi:RNA polymerase sigma-70 factor (ECF subfamily)
MRGFGLGAEDARDVVQESFLKLLEALPGYRGEGSFRGWLRQIVRSCCLLHLRRRRALEPLEEALPDPAQEETLARIERGFVLADAVAQLEPACRDVIARFFFEGRSYKEIAQVLAIPEGTVASRRCLAKLRPKVGGRV